MAKSNKDRSNNTTTNTTRPSPPRATAVRSVSASSPTASSSKLYIPIAPDPVRQSSGSVSNTPGRVVAPSVKPVEPGKPVVAPSQARVVRQTKLKVTTRQLERSGIASRSVPKARTDSVSAVRGKSSPPEKAVDAKRRGAQPAKSAPSKAENQTKREKPAARSSEHSDARQEKRPEPAHCKARPKDNKPKKGGGGSKRFVPWC